MKGVVIMKFLKRKYEKYKLKQERKKRSLALQKLAGELADTLMQRADLDIPVFIISYNNITYVENMVKQLNALDIKPIVIDNNSIETCKSRLSLLKNNQAADVLFCEFNCGHMIGFFDEIYNVFPEVFAYTDPDLQFLPNIPKDFVSQLAEITKQYSVYKAGCALPTIEPLTKEKAFPLTITIGACKEPFSIPKTEFTAEKWEAFYWRLPIVHPNLELYAAKIDTTFAVYRKSNFRYDFYDGIRVAGVFSAIHLPWFPNLDIMSKEEREIYLQKGNVSATWKVS